MKGWDVVSLEAIREYAAQEVAAAKQGWTEATKSNPGLIDGKAKKILMTNGKQTEIGYWYPEHFHTEEFEDGDEDQCEWLVPDEEKVVFWNKEGYYYYTEDTYHGSVVREFKPTYWQPFPSPPTPQP